jgi:hypothetical protein
MKKNILLIAAALFLFLGNQSIAAQAKLEKQEQSVKTQKTNVIAKEKTMSLIRPLNLNKEQQVQVYEVLAKVGGKMKSAEANPDLKVKEEKQAKMNKYVMSKMKEILSEEQYKKYLELAKDL